MPASAIASASVVSLSATACDTVDMATLVRPRPSTVTIASDSSVKTIDTPRSLRAATTIRDVLT